MYVYLKRGSVIKRFRNVVLNDCYQPKVDGVTVERIEPGLWFKVLFVDSLFVDCDGRDVSWNKDTCVDAETIHKTKDDELQVETLMAFFQSKGKIFEGEGCYDFDIFVDELFDTAGIIVDELEKYETRTDEKGLNETKQKLLRLMHVFILPALKLRESELSNLQTVLSWIEHKHQSIEITIAKKDKTKYNVENSLRQQRERLLMEHDFNSQQYVTTCDNEFLQIFLKHLQKDIDSLNSKLLDFDREIKPLRGSVGEKDVKRLSVRRAERDKTLAYIDKAIEARETIKNVVGRPHVLKKIKPSWRKQTQPFHVLYVDITNRLAEMTKEIQDLIRTKIQISSVREATLLTIAEITEDGESYGFERKAGSFEFETDIYDPKNKPDEWATLSEKVSDLLKAKPLGFRDSHERFCKRIRLKCQCLLDDSKLFSSSFRHTGLIVDNEETDSTSPIPISPATAQVLNMLGQESVDRRSALSSSYSSSTSRRDVIRSAARSRSYSTRFSFGNIPKEATEAICKEVIAHISEMAENLAAELYNSPASVIHRSVINKIYICYESHISAELIPVLQDLYEQSYRKQCEGLSRWISSISLSDIGFDDKKFEMIVSPQTAKTIAEEGAQRPVSSEETEVKVPLSEERKRLSLEELVKLSVDDLYKYSNMELTGRESLLSCAPVMDDWVNINCESGNRGDETNILEHTHQDISVSQPEKKRTDGMGAIEMDAIEALDHDSVFESDTPGVKPGVSPTDYAMHFAEDFMKTLNTQRRQSKRVTERKVVNGETDQNHVPLRHDNAESTESLKGAEGLPAYEEVMMRHGSPPPDYSEVSPARAVFYETFEMFETILRKETEAVSLFKKLRVMTKAIQYIEKEISNLKADGKSTVAVCADDILDIVILLLSRLEADTLLKVYAHMNLMIHLSPTFMHGNAHDYALVTFNVAYQHLFEQHVLNKSPKY